MLELSKIRFDAFDFFGNTKSRNIRAGAFLAVYNLCSSNALKRTPVKTALEAIAAAINDIGEDEDDGEEEGEDLQSQTGIKRENRIYTRLQDYNLIRTMVLYDKEEGRETRYACLTGHGQKLYSFLDDYSRSDLKETKDVNIHNATVNMEILTTDRENESDYAYAFESLQRNIFDLIEHMSTYNAKFLDFIDEIGKEFTDHKKIAGTMHRLFTSNFIKDYHSFTANAMPFRTSINRIASKIDSLSDDMICRIAKSRLAHLTTQTDSVPSYDEVKTETCQILEGVSNMCVHDYGYYMSEISTRVTEVLSRIRIVTDSFSINGRAGLSAMLLKLLRHCEDNDIPMPGNIIDAYSCRYVGAWALKPKAVISKKEVYTEDTNKYESTQDEAGISEDDTMALQMKCIAYMDQHFPLGVKVNIQGLPCSTPDDYYCIISLLNLAGEVGAPERKELFIIESESSNLPAFNAEGYMLPSVVIQRRAEAA